MNDQTLLEGMDLPSINPNEELETISRQRLLLLFDIARFEIRSEDRRDKGIDFHFELKKNEKYTNFRLAVQLKSTESEKNNTDGSISLQIQTSNINYLLNNGMPAYYVLYVITTGKFYYQSINDFVKKLSGKDINWQSQSSHTLRFASELSENAITGMYNTTLKKGQFQRSVNEKLINQSTSFPKGDKIIVSEDLTVTSDQEIRKLIEDGGFYLINEGRWKEIIGVSKNASGNIATSAKYNLILGISNYYNGNLIDALSFLKNADRIKTELSDDILHLLDYFFAITKYALGFLNSDEYQHQISKLENSETVGLYIKLEQAKRKYYENMSADSDTTLKILLDDFNVIMNDPKADEGIQLQAKCELIYLIGSKNNWDQVKNVAMLNNLEELMGPNPAARKQSVHSFISALTSWRKEVQDLKHQTLTRRNYFFYYNVVVNEVKVMYEMHVFTAIIEIERKIPGKEIPQRPDATPLFDDLQEKLNKALHYYRSLGHIENEVVALTLLYEILHYRNEFTKAEEYLTEAERLIDLYELRDKKAQLAFLKNEGSTHQKFQSFINESKQEAENNLKEWHQLVEEMSKMDEAEKSAERSRAESYTIQLFPIGHFQFPETEVQIVLDILNVRQPEIRERFASMFGEFIPIANIFYHEITSEGPAEGKLADKGIESWQNVHRIRKSFFENKFYRIELS